MIAVDKKAFWARQCLSGGASARRKYKTAPAIGSMAILIT
jgi:hypothetical protein